MEGQQDSKGRNFPTVLSSLKGVGILEFIASGYAADIAG